MVMRGSSGLGLVEGSESNESGSGGASFHGEPPTSPSTAIPTTQNGFQGTQHCAAPTAASGAATLAHTTAHHRLILADGQSEWRDGSEAPHRHKLKIIGQKLFSTCSRMVMRWDSGSLTSFGLGLQ